MSGKGKQTAKLLSLCTAAVILFSSLGVGLGIGAKLVAKADNTYTVPNANFTGITALLGNSNEKKPTWCWEGGGTSASIDDLSYQLAGNSAKLYNAANNLPNNVFVDLYGSSALAAGKDYTLYAYVYMVDTAKQNATDNDHGFLLRVTDWKTDDTGPNWDASGSDFKMAGIGDTAGAWKKVKLDFTVPAGVSTVRIQGRLNYCSGTAYMTNFIITDRGAAAPADPVVETASGTYTVPNAKFTGITALLGNSNDKKPTWCWEGGGTSASIADVSYQQSGKSARLYNAANNLPNNVFVDLYGSSALTAGKDYTLYAYVYMANTAKQNANDNDHGFLLRVTDWKTDDSGPNWDASGSDFKMAGIGDTAGTWKKVKLDFSVPAGVSTVRIQGRLNYCSGYAFMTNFIITDRGAAEPAGPVVEKAAFPYSDFSRMSDLVPTFLVEDETNIKVPKDRWAGWTNDTAGSKFELSGVSNKTGGSSAKLTCGGDVVVNVFEDLSGSNALAPGEYTLSAKVKTDNVVTSTANADDQGANLRVVNWKPDNSGVNWETASTDFKKSGIKGTQDWTEYSVNFTVQPGVTTVRILVTMNNCRGSAYFTDLAITTRSIFEDDGIYDIPYADFTGMDALSPVLLDNSNDKKPRWCGWSNVDSSTREVSTVAHTTGGRSLKMKNVASASNQIFEDLYDDNQLPAGDYTLTCWVKLDDVAAEGFQLVVCSWKTDDSGVNWEKSGYDFRGTIYKGTSDWQQISLEFSVPQGVKTTRIQAAMNSPSGTAYVTEFAIAKKSVEPSLPEVANPNFEDTFTLKQNDTPAGVAGDAIRYSWGAWLGSSKDGSSVSQAFSDAFSLVTDTVPDGFSAAMKINAHTGTRYELRQIIENLDPDVEYVLRAKVKTDALTGNGGAFVRAAFVTDDKQMIWEVDGKEMYSKTLTGTNDWQDLYVKFKLPSGATSLFLTGGVMDAEGTAYFTNFELLPAAFYDDSGSNNNTDTSGGTPTGTSSTPTQTNPGTGSLPIAPVVLLGVVAMTAGMVSVKLRRR